MDSSYTSRPHKLGSDSTDSSDLLTLVLHNDDVNTFEYVMDSLVEVCGHSSTQAEQCAMIAHYKGKCDIRTGERQQLSEMRFRLISKGLKATIE